MELIIAIIVGLLIGFYYHKKKKYLTVKDWFFGLFVILIAVIITSGFMHKDALVEGFQDGIKEDVDLK
ncbi:hypothetical protein [Staphylococcus equorum]|uniref:hypothetical protein n=1 Tax=Staphylococcus equorum TaxID=246432 RepID=UPI000853C756|nr:hypothetical protein [Staphylococcus equorum]OEL08362.1 hypothetical protein AST04_07955 [Staphylococcus equorum]